MRARVALLLLAVSAGANARADDYFAKVDLDGDGMVSLPEFLDRMSYAFGQMDADGNAVLDSGEQHVPDAPALTLAEHHARISAQFRRQDRDGDGLLTREELLAPPR
jgi:Ca2+-binding EF-hand superfamily protein